MEEGLKASFQPYLRCIDHPHSFTTNTCHIEMLIIKYAKGQCGPENYHFRMTITDQEEARFIYAFGADAMHIAAFHPGNLPDGRLPIHIATKLLQSGAAVLAEWRPVYVHEGSLWTGHTVSFPTVVDAYFTRPKHEKYETDYFVRSCEKV